VHRISVEAFCPDGGAAMPKSHYEVPEKYSESDAGAALNKLIGGGRV